MNKGGYQIIDLKGVALTSGTEKTIDGTYATLLNAHGKRTVISGMKVGSTLYNDFEAVFVFNAGSTVFNAALTIGDAAVAIAIDSGDGVTVTVTTD